MKVYQRHHTFIASNSLLAQPPQRQRVNTAKHASPPSLVLSAASTTSVISSPALQDAQPHSSRVINQSSFIQLQQPCEMSYYEVSPVKSAKKSMPKHSNASTAQSSAQPSFDQQQSPVKVFNRRTKTETSPNALITAADIRINRDKRSHTQVKAITSTPGRTFKARCSIRMLSNNLQHLKSLADLSCSSDSSDDDSDAEEEEHDIWGNNHELLMRGIDVISFTDSSNVALPPQIIYKARSLFYPSDPQPSTDNTHHDKQIQEDYSMLASFQSATRKNKNKNHNARRSSNKQTQQPTGRRFKNSYIVQLERERFFHGFTFPKDVQSAPHYVAFAQYYKTYKGLAANRTKTRAAHHHHHASASVTSSPKKTPIKVVLNKQFALNNFLGSPGRGPMESAMLPPPLAMTPIPQAILSTAAAAALTSINKTSAVKNEQILSYISRRRVRSSTSTFLPVINQ